MEEQMSRAKLLIIFMAAGLFATGLLVDAGAAEQQKKEKKVQKKEVAVITTSLGKIEVEFFSDKAPGHVANFTKLAKSGFYDSTYFHRVIPGFMIQGGDPNTKDGNRANDGMGGPGYTIDAEFNDVHHARGILSMARSQDPNSAGSQFFIMVDDAPYLDGQYTAFGKVIGGMDVVDKIVGAPRDGRDNPLKSIYITHVSLEER
jgi:peptidyl-prolyl cis-trans isomerase B (cyclophilin B)